MKTLSKTTKRGILLRLYSIASRFFKYAVLAVLALNLGVLIGNGLVYLLDKLGLADGLFRFMEAIIFL